MSSLGKPKRVFRFVALSATCACAALLGSCASNSSKTSSASSGASTSNPHSGSRSTERRSPEPSSAGPTTTTPSSQTVWTTYGGSLARTSIDSGDPQFTQAPTEAWTSQALDGQVYGEPLIYDNDVFVGTENDTVYAMSAANGAILWSDHLATPAAASSLPCGDITPVNGITSTMVIDPATSVLYASTEVATASGGVGHEMFAISLADHQVLWSRDLDQPGWTASAQLQRAGLGISDGHVMVGFGGNYGDCGNYHGWVIGVPESGSGPLLAYKVPTALQGGIWGPAGITVDPAGDVFVATGNGSAVQGQPFDHGDAVIELSPQLSEIQYFAPTDWAQDNEDDGDLGSTSPVLLGNGQLFEVGKESTSYLLNASTLGGIGGQVASLNVCFSIGATAYLSPSAYVVCNTEGRIIQVVIGPGNSMHLGWTWTSPSGGASSPTIAGGVMWAIDPGASTLYGIDLSNGTTLYSQPFHVGALAHFVAVSAAEGMLVLAGFGGVEAFR